VKRLAILALLMLITACSNTPTVIDGSSPENFARTTEKARRDLPIKERLTFDAAIHNPSGRRYGSNNTEALAREAYHGMTAVDVVADARARGIE
jgi:PBP1b-binding outer membrane lipoprotein LpoB